MADAELEPVNSCIIQSERPVNIGGRAKKSYMKKYILLLLYGWVALTVMAQPPNNNIFYGGAGDGIHNGAFAIATGNIFLGSAGDGFGNASNNSLSNAIFTGGAGDGVSFVSNNSLFNTIFSGGVGDGFAAQTNNGISNNIFLGSAGDGFSKESNNIVSNLIFSGSVGDGFVNSGNLAFSNSIFNGGEGDGWSAVLLPLGPLPVMLLSFTAEAVGTSHLIKWVTTSEINTNRFEVQRSANGRDFVSVGNKTPMGGSGNGATYSFNVSQPWQGNNFYRLKMVDNDGTVAYTNIVLLKNTAGLQVSVYPNPTADWLYVSIPAFANSQPINASLLDGAGKLVAQPLLIAGTRNGIAVSHLPAGVYTLRCIIQQQNFVVRFIKQR